MTATQPNDLESQARRIYSALANRDSLLIFNLAAEGIEGSLSMLGKYRLSKKRYYTRLKELVGLGLLQKQEGEYRHTALGTLVYENEVQGLKRILLSRSSIEVLQSLKSHTRDPEGLGVVDSISRELLKELESRLGLSGLRPVRLFRSWDELVSEVAQFIDGMRSDLYVATRYVDFRTTESALRGASRGCRINIIHSSRGGLSTKLQVLGNLMGNPKALNTFWNLVRSPNVSMGQAEVPYSFIVIDGLDVGIEIVDPSDPYSFFLGLRFQSPTLAQRLISYFNDLKKTAVKDAMATMFEKPIEEILRFYQEG